MAGQDNLGEIKINNDVVQTIAWHAADEVVGIVKPSGKWGRGNQGITVEIEDNRVEVGIEVRVEYGIDIYKAAHQLQAAIKNAVENMTGLMVKGVNVSVREIVPSDPGRRTARGDTGEIESIAGG